MTYSTLSVSILNLVYHTPLNSLCLSYRLVIMFLMEEGNLLLSGEWMDGWMDWSLCYANYAIICYGPGNPEAGR